MCYYLFDYAALFGLDEIHIHLVILTLCIFCCLRMRHIPPPAHSIENKQTKMCK